MRSVAFAPDIVDLFGTRCVRAFVCMSQPDRDKNSTIATCEAVTRAFATAGVRAVLLVDRPSEECSSVPIDTQEPSGVAAIRESVLSGREAAVLQLISEGLDTAEIAEQLCYSIRTVKSVVHEVTRRLHLRNRAHAVAYAIRLGLI
jgi:DNA-binding NarL/FixJ family response regulator